MRKEHDECSSCGYPDVATEEYDGRDLCDICANTKVGNITKHMGTAYTETAVELAPVLAYIGNALLHTIRQKG